MGSRPRHLAALAAVLLVSVASVWRSNDSVLSSWFADSLPREVKADTFATTHVGNGSISGNGVDAGARTLQPWSTTERMSDATEHTSSACLIWQDDYHRLVEWIAYHYYTMSLRFLVIFRDPASTQDLTPLLKRWESRMHIEVWHNATEFASTEQIRQKMVKAQQHFQQTNSNKANYKLYRLNHLEFWRSCSLHMQHHRRTWTFYIDTDEFIILNGKLVPNATHLMTLPGSALSTIEYIQHHNLTDGNSLFEKPCINFARTQYGAIESPDDDVRRSVPAFLDPYRFQTLRFRHTQAKKLFGKTIADVSRLDFVAPEQMNVHRLIKEVCPSAWERSRAVLHIAHYVASLELYLRPADRRGMQNRTKKWYEQGRMELAMPGLPIGDAARGWVRGFVNHFGEQTAAYLLQDVGQPYNASTAMERQSPPCGSNCVEQYILDGPIALIHKTLQESSTAAKGDTSQLSLVEYVEAVAATWSAND